MPPQDDDNTTTDATSISAAQALKNGGSTAAPKVTQVRSAQAVPKNMQIKQHEWQPEGGWVSKMADDRFNEVAERAKLKGLTLRDVRVTVTRINEDQTEQRIAIFSGDTVQGQNNPYAGSAGLGGPVVSPGEAFFGVLRKFHYGSPVKAVYRVECWDQTNDNRMITSSFIQLAPSAQLDKMDRALSEGKPPPAFDPGLGSTVTGHPPYNPTSGAQPQHYPQLTSQFPQGVDPTVMNLFGQMQEMQRRHYEEMRALAEKSGQPVPPPPAGFAGLPEDPRIALLQKELELTRAQLPKPKSDTEVLAEKMVAGFASIIEKKFPSTAGVGSTPDSTQAQTQTPSKPPLTRLQQMKKELEEEEEMWSLEERFKKMRAKYGLGAPEEEEVTPPVVEAKPEEELPTKLVPVEGLSLFGQQFQRVVHKDENVGLGQVAWDHFMANPGAQEYALKLAGTFAEKLAEPIMNIMTKLSTATAPKPQQVGVGNVPNTRNRGWEGSTAQVVEEVPPGAVDAGGDDKPSGGVI